MARSKNYNEEEVIEKAMNLFWRNGYESTSTRMLEKEMGINQFSIYSSFGSKKGVLLESVKCYKRKISGIINILESSTGGKQSIKQYFYNFIEFSNEDENRKGCLLSNTSTELRNSDAKDILDEIRDFTISLRNIFLAKLKENSTDDIVSLKRKSNYLIVSMTGLSVASKVYNKQQIDDYIETAFDLL